MGVDYYNCEICDEIFNDHGHYGNCGNCESMLCGDCYDSMRAKNGELGEDHEKASWYGEYSPNYCDKCDGTVIDKTAFFEFLADKLGQTTEELEAEYRAHMQRKEGAHARTNRAN
ncbi:hypothetical protein MHZ92_14575 [Sporosarcina sp. ACRSL]|uniref:hypothetical protein n=1 Tax=Sporosarcina sp. ACRSL TaxID=2918215 RepID=UPI001EF64BF8|nr:hypothetical protein [Sporosarcina sp. ACRSL]MCG7345361.1 hypothetical protein [Sporosarcina sp. ACRSL]